MWTLIIAIHLNAGGQVFEEFPVFDSSTDCDDVIESWLEVPVTGGYVILGACQPTEVQRT